MRTSHRAWQRLFAGLLATLALPVCAAGPKSPPAPSKSTASPPWASTSVASPSPSADAKATVSKATGKSGDQAIGRKVVVRQPDESLEQLAARILPPGAETITKPLEFQLPPLGKVVLVLYQVSSDDPTTVTDPSVYRGWALVPDDKPDLYRVERLPSLKDGAATLMYEVKSIFTADADRDGDPEICILSEIAEAGVGDSAKSHTDTDLFKWSGSGFTMIEQGDNRPLYNLHDAKAVRARLKKMHVP